jgi:hypothetical protein
VYHHDDVPFKKISFSYPFDVNEAILWLAELCDIIFVFFDPIGQALCKRTLNIVEKIREQGITVIRVISVWQALYLFTYVWISFNKLGAIGRGSKSSKVV